MNWAWNASAFLFFSLSLAIPSGYSYGAVALLICTLLSLRHGIDRYLRTFALTGITLLMGLLWGHGFDGWLTLTGSDNWPKYWLAAGCIAVAARHAIHSQSVQWGVATGAVGALAIALFQYLMLGWSKASGFTNAIQYGGIAMYLGLATWCFALLGQRSSGVQLVLWVTGACGVVASLMSETRGAWVVAPALVVCLIWFLAQAGKWQQALGLVLSAVVLAVAVILPNVDKFGSRAQQAVSEFQSYQRDPHAAAVTSIGQRMEQWRLAVAMGQSKPLTGWGVSGVVDGKAAYVAQGVAHPSVMGYGHAHNEILDMWAKRGLLGVLVLLLFYAVPLWVFWPTQQRLALVPSEDRSMTLAVRGAASLLPIAYFGFGWTQVFFAHNSGNLFYLFAIVVFWSAIKGLEQPARAKL